MKHLILASLMLTLLAGCGKDEKKSTPPVAETQNAVDPVVDPNADQETQLAKLNAWYAAADTVNIGSAGTFKRKTEKFSTGMFSFNFKFDFFTSYKPNFCYLGSPSTQAYQVGTPNNGVCESLVDGSKANNLKLKRAINGEDGALQLIYIQTRGSQYVLYYGQNVQNLYQPSQTVVVHVIDTNAHSILNPVQTVDLRSKTDDYVQAIQQRLP